MIFSKEEIGRHFPVFEEELIDVLFESAEVKYFEEGETIMRTGQYIRNTILIWDGLIKVYREDEEGNEFFMYYLDSGKACALSMICAVKQEKSELMAKAVTKTTILTLPLPLMEEWMTKYKTWYHFVLGSYRERFEELLVTIDHIAFRNMDERLVFYLKRHSEKMGTNIITTSFTDIAQDLNSSREVISRLMKKLADKGVIKLHKSNIELVNLDEVLS